MSNPSKKPELDINININVQDHRKGIESSNHVAVSIGQIKSEVLAGQILLVFFLVCFCSFLTRAQQLLNLDFEKKSIEGLSRPWGWDLTTDPKSIVTMDSTIKKHGNYSLKINASSDLEQKFQELTFSLEPYELQGTSVIINGWIKTSNLKGFASLLVRFTLGNDATPTEIKHKPIVNSTEWSPVSVHFKLPDKINSIYLAICLEGTGTAWFDNFSLSVNGKSMLKLEVAAPFTRRHIKWLEDNSFPIKTVDATQANSIPDFSDLASLKSILEEARIIALGESTHGTSEFFRLKHRILEYCVRELGIRTFAIEDHQLVAAQVNKYVLGGKGTARSCMYGMLGVWQTREVHDLIQWIRNYNDSHADNKVEFVGFDIQNVTMPIDCVYSFSSRQSLELYQTAKELLDGMKQNGMNSYMFSDSVKYDWLNNANKVLERFSESSTDWLSKSKNRQDSLSIYWGIQYARLVKQFAENVYKGHSSLYRDIAMAENVSWIINVYKPGAKALLWAHDVHISRGEHPDSEKNIYYGNSMGAHLSKAYENKYKSFGLFTYQGEYSCYVSYSNFNVTSCPLYIAPKGSLDEALHRVAHNKKSPGLFLDLNKSKSIKWLCRAIPVRFANHVNIEYGYWTQYSIPYQFDGIFFLDKTTSAKSYARN